MNTVRATLLLALLFVSSTAQAITIGSITLTDLGAGVVPNAININGQVVGQNGSGQAFLWQNNTMTAISMPSGTQSVANDINDSGEVVGWFDNSSGLQHAFEWTSGTATDLSAGQTYTSDANGINSGGNIVGYTQTATYTHSEEWGSQGSRSLFGRTILSLWHQRQRLGGRFSNLCERAVRRKRVRLGRRQPWKCNERFSGLSANRHQQ